MDRTAWNRRPRAALQHPSPESPSDFNKGESQSFWTELFSLTRKTRKPNLSVAVLMGLR